MNLRPSSREWAKSERENKQWYSCVCRKWACGWSNILDSSRSIWNLWGECLWRIWLSYSRGPQGLFITDGMIPCMMECISASVMLPCWTSIIPIQLYHSQSRHCILIPVYLGSTYLVDQNPYVRREWRKFSNLSNVTQHSIKMCTRVMDFMVVRKGRFPHQASAASTHPRHCFSLSLTLCPPLLLTPHPSPMTVMSLKGGTVWFNEP